MTINKSEKFTDTIAATVTPTGQGAVSIIRLSGPDSVTILEKIFTSNKNQKLKNRFVHYGIIKDKDGAVLDDCLAVIMSGPNSYTGEDVVEIFCHGSTLITKRVLSLLFSLGARPADGGEFTKRAFLNGKMDLAEAEAVADIITAETDMALTSAQAQRRGGLSIKVKDIKEGVINLMTLLEAELDFSEEEEVERTASKDIIASINIATGDIGKLLSTFNEGRIIKDGIRVLILGRPNSGKSSLLNVLLKEERAIVTDTPGTTRDVIEDVINLKGLPLRLMDTAGLRETSDKVEALGIKAAKDRILEAGIILYVIDASSEPSEVKEDLKNLEEIRSEDEAKKIIIVMNKADIMKSQGVEPKDILIEFKSDFEPYKVKFISALEEVGIEGLEEFIASELIGENTQISLSGGEVVTNLRHKNCLEKALKHLSMAVEGIISGDAREFTARELREALDALGEITGETTADDILERIFSTFCIGK